PASVISYVSGYEAASAQHLVSGTNVAGYASWGWWSFLGGEYATNGALQWHGNSSWWIIETVESYNGRRATEQGHFTQWFSSNAFGGINFTNVPVGAVSHVDEPGAGGVSDS